jgi:homospermidine synthase
MIAHPEAGLCTPEQLPHRHILATAAPYLGPCPSLQTDWTPLRSRFRPFGPYGEQPPPDDQLWQFGSFLAQW